MRSMRLSDSLRKNQLWNGLVTITLLEGKNIPGGNWAEIFILLKLGDQRYRSKVSIKVFLTLEAIKVLGVSFTNAALSGGTVLEYLFIEERSKPGDQIRDINVVVMFYMPIQKEEVGNIVFN